MILERETKFGSLTLLEIKFHHKVTVIKTLWYKYRDKHTNQKKTTSRNKSSHIWSNGFWQENQDHANKGNTVFSKKNGAGKYRYSHTGKKEIESWSYIMHKNQLKMDQTSKCKKIIKLLKEKLVQKHHDSRFGNDLLAVTPKAQATKEKIR